MKYFWIALIALSSLFVLQGCGSSPSSKTATPTAVPAEEVVEIAAEAEQAPAAEPEVAVEPEDFIEYAGTTKVLIETELGNMEAVLYDNTPGHRDNFVKLINEGFYDGLLFHRVIDGFMIQGGDPESRDAPAGQRLWSGGPGYQIPAEIGAPHIKGTLAAARTNNPQKESSGSQFYISQGTAQSESSLARTEAQKWITYSPAQKEKYLELWWVPMLDAEYTVFGELTTGLDVIDKITAVQTAPGDRPLEDVSMKISIVE